MARVHSELAPMKLGSGKPKPLTAKDTEAALKVVLKGPKLRKEFDEVGEADFSYEIKGVSRFRVNAYRQRGYIYAIKFICTNLVVTKHP